MTTKKQSETAVILRAGRAKAPTHNAAARAALKGAKPDAKRVRVMLNVPPEMIGPIKAAAAKGMVSMSMYFVYAAKEKLEREEE